MNNPVPVPHSHSEVPPGQLGRLVLPDCPGCDMPVSLENVALNEQVTCPNCKSVILLVRIDGVVMFLREGWI